jgi:peptide/nickel transport system substrate-binding protein
MALARAFCHKGAMISRPVLIAALTLTLAACGTERSDTGPVVVSAIGGRPGYADANKHQLDTTQRLLLDSTAQGLVRFDASGQIEPGLAERWIVIDDGRTYIFRLRAAEWPDGQQVTAADVVKVLRRAIAPDSKNALKPFLSAVGTVIEMTPQVIEVHLSRPRPDLLKLFAQPELAILRADPMGGSGPFRVVDKEGLGVVLRPAFDPARSPDDEIEEPGPEQTVQLIGEPAANAILRFQKGHSDFVAGGTATDWPVLALVKIPPANVRLDPAAGLFGLAIVHREGFLATAEGRAAIAQALNRPAILGAFTPDWAPIERLLPDALDSASPPANAPWVSLSADARLALAQQQVAAWRASNDTAPTVRIALPAGSGGSLLFAQIGQQLVAAGIRPVRVGWRDDADLRLIDEVAPYDSARWYLATACVACSDEAVAAITAARDAPTMAERAQHIAEADAAMATDTAFIPIAPPLRWSLVSARLKQWQGNSRAWHPLNRLRNDTN